MDAVTSTSPILSLLQPLQAGYAARETEPEGRWPGLQEHSSSLQICRPTFCQLSTVYLQLSGHLNIAHWVLHISHLVDPAIHGPNGRI